MRTQWGVKAQRNDGPLDAGGHTRIRDEWSHTLTWEWDTEEQALAQVRRMRQAPRSWRRVTVVKRQVSAWERVPR